MKRPFYVFFTVCLILVFTAFPEKFAIGRRPSSNLETLPDDEVVEDDTIEFLNGDVITGSINSIHKGTIEFNGKMISGTSTIDLGNVKKILFPKEIEGEIKSEKDQVIFPSHDRLSLNIKSMNGKTLIGETLTGDSIELSRDKLEGLVFKKVPVKILDQDFEDADKLRFKQVTGEWIVEDGKYIQKNTKSSSYRASCLLTQQGRFRYQWSIDTSKSNVTGFYFFAKNGKTIHGGESYYVMLSGNSVYLYKCVSDNQQYYASYTIPSKGGIVKFDMDFDSEKGAIILKIDGKEAMRWKDKKPIEKGRYIMLYASGQASFDDIIVSRTGGSFLPSLASEENNEDVILFVNGDVLSGTVVSVSEENVVIENEYDPEGVVISKSKISSMRFSGKGDEGELLDSSDIYKLTMWNDDIISGDILKLDKDFLRIDTNTAGELVFPRKLLKRIDAPPKLSI